MPCCCCDCYPFSNITSPVFFSDSSESAIVDLHGSQIAKKSASNPHFLANQVKKKVIKTLYNHSRNEGLQKISFDLHSIYALALSYPHFLFFYQPGAQGSDLRPTWSDLKLYANAIVAMHGAILLWLGCWDLLNYGADR